VLIAPGGQGAAGHFGKIAPGCQDRAFHLPQGGGQRDALLFHFLDTKVNRRERLLPRADALERLVSIETQERPQDFARAVPRKQIRSKDGEHLLSLEKRIERRINKQALRAAPAPGVRFHPPVATPEQGEVRGVLREEAGNLQFVKRPEQAEVVHRWGVILSGAKDLLFGRN